MLIVASAGTSGAGMIDPLPDCAALAQRHRLWYHIDAAWGGAMIASEKLRGVLAGLERADSATIDAHKWFATTMGCGMFLIRDATTLPAVFQVAASYMPSHQASVDPYMNSVQWSRRFLGLRLFLSLASAGWAGHAAHIERAVEQAARIRQGLEARGWSVVNDSPLAVLAAVPPPALGSARDDRASECSSPDARGCPSPASRSARWCASASRTVKLARRICRSCLTLSRVRSPSKVSPSQPAGLLRICRVLCTNARIVAQDSKFSGVMSACGIAISNSNSTASIKLTILSELMPKSLSCVFSGNGSGTSPRDPRTCLTSAISRSHTAFGADSTR